MLPFFIVGSLASFSAGLAQSSLGFGMALIMAPCIALVIEPVAVVPTIVLMSTVNTFLVALRNKRMIKWRLLVPLSIGGLIGASLGLNVLLQLDPDIMRLFIGILVLTFTGILWSGWQHPLREKPWTILSVGFVSGFTGGATSISGPPVVLFLANQNMPRDVFRANLTSYFFLLNCFMITWLSWNDVMRGSIVLNAAALFPATLTGTLIGLYFGRRIPENAFRRAVFIVLLIMGSMLVYHGIFHG